MQAWDHVKVKNPDSPFVGRAGIVETAPATPGGFNVVRLDADGANPTVIEKFEDADLDFLGRA